MYLNKVHSEPLLKKYASCVGSSIVYCSEIIARLLLSNVELKVERAGMQMIRYMCSVSMKDRRTGEELRKLAGGESITTVIRSGRLSWYGPVRRNG